MLLALTVKFTRQKQRMDICWKFTESKWRRLQQCLERALFLFCMAFSQPRPIILWQGRKKLCVSFAFKVKRTFILKPFKAYLLSNNGYDVWLGNVRGSDHSLKHKTLSVQSKEFWNFSFHEIGFYDLPAMFDLMLEKTKAQQGFYVGHSRKLFLPSFNIFWQFATFRGRSFCDDFAVDETGI